jgi:RNA polymerase sigma-70 factor (ECF subfamily)
MSHWPEHSSGAVASLALGWEMSEVPDPHAAALEPADDARLVAEFVRTRRSDLFELLVDRHKEKIFRLALAVLGPGLEAEAEEVTQEAFVTAFRQLPSFRSESRFGTWLYRIALRKAIDVRRSARLRHLHAGEDALVDGPLAGSPEAGPHERAEAGQKRRALLCALAELPDPYPTVLRLFYWLDWSVADISAALAIAPGTVKSHLFRAREMLFKKLKKKGFSDANSLF